MTYVVIKELEETGLKYCPYITNNYYEAVGYIENCIQDKLDSLKYDKEEKLESVNRFWEIEGGEGIGWTVKTKHIDNDNVFTEKWLLIRHEKNLGVK